MINMIGSRTSALLDKVEELFQNEYDKGYEESAYWILNNIKPTKEQIEKIKEHLDKEGFDVY